MKLVIENDEGRRTFVPLGATALQIGRDEGNHVRLDEKNVSRRHARLVRKEDRVILEDLNSFTGVRVNGERIVGACRIKQGDLVQIGEFDLFVEYGPDDKPPADEEADEGGPAARKGRVEGGGSEGGGSGADEEEEGYSAKGQSRAHMVDNQTLQHGRSPAQAPRLEGRQRPAPGEGQAASPNRPSAAAASSRSAPAAALEKGAAQKRAASSSSAVGGASEQGQPTRSLIDQLVEWSPFWRLAAVAAAVLVVGFFTVGPGAASPAAERRQARSPPPEPPPPASAARQAVAERVSEPIAGTAPEADAQAKRLLQSASLKIASGEVDAGLGELRQAADLRPSGPVLGSLYRSLAQALLRRKGPGDEAQAIGYYRLYVPLCDNPAERSALQRSVEEFEARRGQR
jgi:hypothetical protein